MLRHRGGQYRRCCDVLCYWPQGTILNPMSSSAWRAFGFLKSLHHLQQSTLSNDHGSLTSLMQAWYYKFLVFLDGFLIALLNFLLELRLSRLSWCLFSLLLEGIELCLKLLVCGR